MFFDPVSNPGDNFVSRYIYVIHPPPHRPPVTSPCEKKQVYKPLVRFETHVSGVDTGRRTGIVGTVIRTYRTAAEGNTKVDYRRHNEDLIFLAALMSAGCPLSLHRHRTTLSLPPPRNNGSLTAPATRQHGNVGRC